MMITFNAFSFLQNKLSEQGFGFYNVAMEMAENSTANELLCNLKLDRDDVEGVFVNGKISPLNTILKDGDRVGLLPPGTPGPYRVMLGIVKQNVINIK